MLKTGKDLLFSLRPSRHIHYTVLFTLGYVIYNGLSFGNVWEYFMGIIVINLLFSSALLINSVFDAEIDGINRKANLVNQIKVNEKLWFILYAILNILLLSLSLFSGIIQFAVCSLLCLMSYLYSSPPVRLKKIFIVNLFIIALAATGTVFLAYIWSEPEKAIKTFDFRAGAIMTVLLALAFSVKDVNDYEGDVKGGVVTVMTVLGEKKGRIVTACLALTAYFAAPFAVNSYDMLPYALIAGVLTYFTVMAGKKVNEAVVFLVLFIFLAVYLFLNPIQPEMPGRL